MAAAVSPLRGIPVSSVQPPSREPENAKSAGIGTADDGQTLPPLLCGDGRGVACWPLDNSNECFHRRVIALKSVLDLQGQQYSTMLESRPRTQSKF